MHLACREIKIEYWLLSYWFIKPILSSDNGVDCGFDSGAEEEAPDRSDS